MKERERENYEKIEQLRMCTVRRGRERDSESDMKEKEDEANGMIIMRKYIYWQTRNYVRTVNATCVCVSVWHA